MGPAAMAVMGQHYDAHEGLHTTYNLDSRADRHLRRADVEVQIGEEMMMDGPLA